MNRLQSQYLSREIGTSAKGVIELPASQKGKTGLDNLSEQPRTSRDRPGRGTQPGQPPRN